MAFYFYIFLLLSGLTGTCSVTTVRKVSVKVGQSLLIPCRYESQYRTNVKYLCGGNSWSSCSYVIKSNEPQKSRFSISDDKHQRIFTVTMRELNNVYAHLWCAVEIDDGLDVKQYFELSFTRGTPILSVNDQEITGFVGENVSIEFNQKTPGNIKCCRLSRACVANPSGFIDGTRVNIRKTNGIGSTVTMVGLKPESAGWYLCETEDYQMPVHLTVNEKPTTAATTGEPSATSVENGKASTSFDLQKLIIPLSVLIVIVIVTLIIWILLRRKQTNAEAPATTKAEDEVTYSSVVHMKQNPSQRSHDEPEEDVLYSSVVTRKIPKAKISSLAQSNENVVYASGVAEKPQPTKKTGKGVEDIIYSTVAEHSEVIHVSIPPE